MAPQVINNTHVRIPWTKWLTNALGIAGIILVTMGAVWTGATMMADKAEKSEVRTLKEVIYVIQTDIAVIKNILENMQDQK